MNKTSKIVLKLIFSWFYLLGCDDQQRIKKDMVEINERKMSFLEALKFVLFPPESYEQGD